MHYFGMVLMRLKFMNITFDGVFLKVPVENCIVGML